MYLFKVNSGSLLVLGYFFYSLTLFLELFSLIEGKATLWLIICWRTKEKNFKKNL